MDRKRAEDLRDALVWLLEHPNADAYERQEYIGRALDLDESRTLGSEREMVR